MSIIRKEQLTNPLSASYALTASYAENASSTSVNTSSLLTTASVNLNTITFTKGNGSTFLITVDTGSGGTVDTSGLVTTSSFNAFTSSINQFTSSYNTGSFSGSFTGNFNGTASWATNAQTASYVLGTNVYGPNGFNTIYRASISDGTELANTASIANSVLPLLQQNLTINGQFTTNTDPSSISSTSSLYTGHIINGKVGDSSTDGDLIYLDTDNQWYQVSQSNDTSTKMLGVLVNSGQNVLLEGDITLDASYITNPGYGLPVYISGSARFTTNSSSLVSGYIRVVGHTYYNDGSNWILRFKPSNDWTVI